MMVIKRSLFPMAMMLFLRICFNEAYLTVIKKSFQKTVMHFLRICVLCITVFIRLYHE